MNRTLEHILPKVQKPARYTGGEYNAIVKDRRTVDTRYALCFPDTYEIGMSNLGCRILYGLMNEVDGLWCERCYAPWGDMEDEMRREGLLLYGLESGDPISDFDIIGFSLGYEMAYSNVLNMLDLAGIPICGSAGDQPAALFGQACFTPGQAKNTYGTGCFTLMNVGGEPVASQSGLVTSVAWSLGGETTYALEGSVFNAGSTIQWLRDELGLISSAPECDRLAESVPDAGGVYVVPAFTGLGAPYWDMYARGTIVGLTRGTTKAHIARAVLDAIAFQVTDLVQAMNADAPCPITTLRVDGGASVSDIMMQTQADLLRLPVDRPAQVETTAFGAAALAGLAAGVWGSLEEVAALRRSQHVFLPQRPQAACEAQYRLWRRAVDRALRWIENDV